MLTGLALYALALFVAGSSPQMPTQADIIQTQYIYSRFYTGKSCENKTIHKVYDKTVRECEQQDGWLDDFYIVFDVKRKYRERYHKLQLLLEFYKLQNKK